MDMAVEFDPSPQQITRVRQALGMTQAEIATMMEGVNRSVICRMEAGTKPINPLLPKLLLREARRRGVSVVARRDGSVEVSFSVPLT
jgi:predicted transcriptional regulator